MASLESLEPLDVPWRVSKDGEVQKVKVTPYLYPGTKEWIQKEKVLVGMISYGRAQKGNFIMQNGEQGKMFLVVVRSQFEAYKSVPSGCSFLVIETNELHDDIKSENPLRDLLSKYPAWQEGDAETKKQFMLKKNLKNMSGTWRDARQNFVLQP